MSDRRVLSGPDGRYRAHMTPTFTRTPHPSPATPERIAEVLANPGFGMHFTDHMVTVRHDRTQGWHDARVEPYRPITLDPAAMVLHYGQAIFEGLKAYRQPNGAIASFRPEANAERLRRSSRRLAMPELPDELFLGSLRELVAVDGRWVPDEDEASLYLRPFMISTEVGLGVRPATEYLYVLIGSPAGSYFASGIKPVSVWLSTEYVRALRPVLEAFGHHPGLRLVLFTVDEDTFSRELAPIAGVYPAVRLGAPWWFLDTPDGMRRFREAVTDTAGFANTTGFVDDTRAFCSIPARHDLARRIDAGFLARLVAEHRLDADEAIETAVDLAYRIPRQAYAPPRTANAFPQSSGSEHGAKEHK